MRQLIKSNLKASGSYIRSVAKQTSRGLQARPEQVSVRRHSRELREDVCEVIRRHAHRFRNGTQRMLLMEVCF
jgi:hypothetical protein